MMRSCIENSLFLYRKLPQYPACTVSMCWGLGATCTLERGLAGVRVAGGGCPLWVPPAGSPVRLIYLAPVLLHPQLIEARRSGAERISGGLGGVPCAIAPLYVLRKGQLYVLGCVRWQPLTDHNEKGRITPVQATIATQMSHCDPEYDLSVRRRVLVAFRY
jgi:hypothetical protein